MYSIAPPHTTDAVTDDQLMSLITEDRSELALEQLFHRYSGVLRTVISRAMRDESDVEDVLQDVFLQVWKRGVSYSKEKGRLLGWLITLARRRALDRLRQRCSYNRARSRYEVEYRKPINEQISLGLNSPNQIFDEDLRDLLSNLMLRLPSNQAEVIRMTFIQGLSQRQIAATLTLPLGTVKTRIELGMRKLHNSLSPIRDKVR